MKQNIRLVVAVFVAVMVAGTGGAIITILTKFFFDAMYEGVAPMYKVLAVAAGLLGAALFMYLPRLAESLIRRILGIEQGKDEKNPSQGQN